VAPTSLLVHQEALERLRGMLIACFCGVEAEALAKDQRGHDGLRPPDNSPRT